MRSNEFNLSRVWAVGLLLLIAATWRLWIPRQDAFSVPLVPGVSLLPTWSDWLPLFAIVAFSLTIVIKGNQFRFVWWLVAISLVLKFAMNQHRMQPWAYQSAIYAVLFGTMHREQARRWLIPLAASIYLYSAAGKFDYQFAHTVGQSFLSATTQWLGKFPDQVSESSRALIALSLPLGEFVVGAGLLFRKTRKIAGLFAMGMHGLLLIVLGPFGLGHSAGVLIWNGLLLVQAWLLFVAPARHSDEESAESASPRPTSVFAKAFIVIAILAPLGERAGLWDHWLSWSLYSPHTSRVEIEIHESAITALRIGREKSVRPLLPGTGPSGASHKRGRTLIFRSLPSPSLSEYLDQDDDGDRWRSFDASRWSLERLRVPIYPQARFQLAVADRLARNHLLGDAIRVIVRGTSDRWTGERTTTRLIGEEEIAKELGQYWLVGR